MSNASLSLTLAARRGYAELRCRPGLELDLARLAGLFSSATAVNAATYRVELHDLMLNLRDLGRWPAEFADSVVWQPELLAIIQANVRDAQNLERALRDNDRPVPAVDVSSLGAEWSTNLTDFQMRDLGRLLSLDHAANFSVPGAGKTRVALAAFESRRQSGDVDSALVVAPKSAYETWKEENLHAFRSRPRRMRVFDGTTAPDCDVLVLNYERLPDAVPELIRWMSTRRTLLILDEAHRMKLGPAGAWGQACFALAPFARHRMILTGTPAPNGSRDLENLIAFLWPGVGRDRVRNALRDGDLRAASRRLRPLYARTMKKELGLPEVNRRVRRVELPPLHRQLYQALLGDFRADAERNRTNIAALGQVVLYLIMAATSPSLLSAGASRYEPLAYRIPPLRAPTGSSLEHLLAQLPSYEMSPKYAEVAAIVASNARVGRKTLVWSTFIRNLTSLARLLTEYRPAVVHGGTEDRDAEIARFRSDPSCLVLLSNPATLGEGISLHHTCHDAVYVDRDFAAGRFLQSLDRIHRLGLEPNQETNVTLLVSEGTIDEVVEDRLATKLTFMGSVLDDTDVLELADLSDEPAEGAGMDGVDMQRLLEHLGARPPR